ncbi:MAG: sigma-70 family RNA polymerase sigma factor [Pseudomonadota bacterium]
MASLPAKKMKKRIPSKLELEDKARRKAAAEVTAAIEHGKRKRGPIHFTKKEMGLLRKRDELIAQYMPFAASIANRVCQTLSSAVDHDEVMCNARLGLLEAAKRFDPKQEVDFRTYAYYRIKGSIYDGLRRSGWLPRTLYAKVRFEEAASEYLQNKAYGAQKDDVLLSKTDEEIADTVNQLASIYIVSLEGSEECENLEEKSSEMDVERRAEFMQVRKYMRAAIADLPDKEKKLIMMYYFQNRTLEEIGKRLELSKSWVSRLHARALEMMLKRIKTLATQTISDNSESTFDTSDVSETFDL